MASSHIMRWITGIIAVPILFSIIYFSTETIFRRLCPRGDRHRHPGVQPPRPRERRHPFEAGASAFRPPGAPGGCAVGPWSDFRRNRPVVPHDFHPLPFRHEGRRPRSQSARTLRPGLPVPAGDAFAPDPPAKRRQGGPVDLLRHRPCLLGRHCRLLRRQDLREAQAHAARQPGQNRRGAPGACRGELWSGVSYMGISSCPK